MKIRDAAERMFWTALAAFLGSLSAGAIFSYNLGVVRAAGIAALGTVITGATVFARARLAVLPDPGAGLPGLPTTP